MEIIYQPWPWYVAGPLITLTMFFLLIMGKRFGISSNLRTLCTICGADKVSDFFKIDVKANRWGLVFVLGTVIGGFISGQFLTPNDYVDLNPATIESLKGLGIENPGDGFVPDKMFAWESVFSLKNFFFLALGGFFIGFGTRYADGCTSGHAITGLSQLKWQSLVAVIGFFIGGLLMTHVFLPYLI